MPHTSRFLFAELSGRKFEGAPCRMAADSPGGHRQQRSTCRYDEGRAMVSGRDRGACGATSRRRVPVFASLWGWWSTRGSRAGGPAERRQRWLAPTSPRSQVGQPQAGATRAISYKDFNDEDSSGVRASVAKCAPHTAATWVQDRASVSPVPCADPPNTVDVLAAGALTLQVRAEYGRRRSA